MHSIQVSIDDLFEIECAQKELSLLLLQTTFNAISYHWHPCNNQNKLCLEPTIIIVNSNSKRREQMSQTQNMSYMAKNEVQKPSTDATLPNALHRYRKLNPKSLIITLWVLVNRNVIVSREEECRGGYIQTKITNEKYIQCTRNDKLASGSFQLWDYT